MKPRLSLFRLGSALVLLGLGAVATYDLDHAATARILPNKLYGWTMFGPGLALLGLLVLVRGCAWGNKVCSRRNVLVAGVVMLGVCAGVWLVAVATDHSGEVPYARAMFVMLATILIGLPGLLLTLATLLLKSDSDRHESK